MTIIENKLKELNIVLPTSNPSAANYLPYIKTGNLIFISGQICALDGELKYTGKVGDKYNVTDAQQAARICGLNILVQIKKACDGDLEKVKKCVRLGVFINSTEDFNQQSLVANGASDLMVDVFGEKGRHVRTAVSSNSLPFDTSVEIDAVFEV